jgi:hypothetical protein
VYTALVQKLLAHGTTTAVYYATIHLEATKRLVDVCRELGQRAIVGKASPGPATGDLALSLSLAPTLIVGKASPGPVTGVGDSARMRLL